METVYALPQSSTRPKNLCQCLQDFSSLKWFISAVRKPCDNFSIVKEFATGYGMIKPFNKSECWVQRPETATTTSAIDKLTDPWLTTFERFTLKPSKDKHFKSTTDRSSHKFVLITAVSVKCMLTELPVKAGHNSQPLLRTARPRKHFLL